MTSFLIVNAPGVAEASDSPPQDDELHSAVDTVKLERTPAYDDAVGRFIKLGLTQQEAEQVLKG